MVDGVRSQVAGNDVGPIGLFANSGAALYALSLAASRNDIGAVVAVSAPYEAISAVSRAPLLMLQGKGLRTELLTAGRAASEYEQKLKERGVPVIVHVYEQSRYAFLSTDPFERTDASQRSAAFFIQYLRT